MWFPRVCLILSLLMGFTGTAYGATPVRETVAAQVMGADSLRMHTLTGAAEMPWADYLGRLGARSEITHKVVEAVTEVP